MSSWFELYGNDYFDSLFMKNLGRDESYLMITNNAEEVPVYLFRTHRECVECDYYKVASIYNREELKVNMNYKYLISRNISYNAQGVLCSLTEPIGEFGVYNMTFDEKQCSVETLLDPVNIYLPIVSVLMMYIGLAFLFISGIKLNSCFGSQQSKGISTETTKIEEKKPRIKSLDTVRGISIVIMIFVNLGGGGYDILEHAPWNGMHLADFVFPCFLWIMGACIPISLTSSFKKGLSNRKIIGIVSIRSLKLFCLGIFVGSGIYLYKIRIMGVLQRFGISYFVVTLICVFLLNRSTLMKQENTKPNWITSLKTTVLAWIPISFIAVAHLLIIFLVADKNCEKGYFGPGGLHKHGKYEGCTGGATGFIDRAILGHHAYQHPTSEKVYNSQPFDPEGIIGCLNSIFHTFIGVQAGVILLVHREHSWRIIHWLSWAALTGIAGGCLCGFSIEDGLIPVNKNLWSLSFVLVTSSISFALLTFCYVLIDMKKWWGGEPFFYAGMNSILMYIGHEITSNRFPFAWKINDYDTQTHFLYFFENVTATILWNLIAYYLYKIKYFFTI
ncbi:hypothetical protein WA026_016348 [Henosepilachna vigintioctopunctata]